MAHQKRTNPFRAVVEAVGNAVGFVVLVPVLLVEAVVSSD